MKKKLIILSVLIGLVGLYRTNAQKNLILNHGFESRTGEAQADDWITIYEPVSSYSKIKHTGDKSIRLTAASAYQRGTINQWGSFDWNTYKRTTQEVEPGAEYKLTYWVLDNANNGRVIHRIKWLKDKDNQYSIIKSVKDELTSSRNASTDNSEWVKMEFAGVAPEGAQTFTISFESHPQDGNYGGSVYIDDISFVKVEPLPAPESLDVVAHQVSAMLSWTAVEKAESYIITYGDKTFETNSTNYILENLTPNTKYEISVKAKADKALEIKKEFTTKDYLKADENKRIPFVYGISENGEITKKFMPTIYDFLTSTLF